MENQKPATSPDMVTRPAGRISPKDAPALAASPVPPDAAGRPVDPLGTPSAALSAADGAESERDGVFRHLVKEDADIAGLVAYSIYKQNKLDWLNAFEQAKGRAPNADEVAAYIIGEGTPRRLVTYRQLAEIMLAGNGGEIGTPAGRGLPRRGISDRGSLTASLIATYALIVVLFLIGFLLAAHYTMTSR